VFDWWEFLALAQGFAGTPREAERRTAISRAYYAAFGAALAWRQACRFFEPLKDGTDHQELWAAFSDSSDEDERYVGQLGHRLRRRRNAADYDERVDDLGDLVTDALEDATEIRALLDGIPC